jgi:SAM-dependent methyltransferase
VIDLAAIKAKAAEPTTLTIPEAESLSHLGGSMRGGIGDPYTYYPNLWAWMVAVTGAKSVVDIGCGHGHALEFFSRLVPLATGVEGHDEAVKDSCQASAVIKHDYAHAPLTFPQPVDLGWCCEFLEHLEECHLDNVFATLASCRTIFITHATPGQGGHHHVNEQLPGYWVLQFMRRGFQLDETMTASARLIAAADKHLLGLPTDSYFMRTGLVFQNQNV